MHNGVENFQRHHSVISLQFASSCVAHFFSSYLFLCAMLFCHHCIFEVFIFVLSTSFCKIYLCAKKISPICSYELFWSIITLFSPCSFLSYSRLLTNRVSFSLKFYIDFATCLSQYVKGNSRQNNGKLSREWTHKRAIIAHILVSFVEFLNWNFAFKRI